MLTLVLWMYCSHSTRSRHSLRGWLCVHQSCAAAQALDLRHVRYPQLTRNASHFWSHRFMHCGVSNCCCCARACVLYAFWGRRFLTTTHNKIAIALGTRPLQTCLTARCSGATSSRACASRCVSRFRRVSCSAGSRLCCLSRGRSWCNSLTMRNTSSCLTRMKPVKNRNRVRNQSWAFKLLCVCMFACCGIER